MIIEPHHTRGDLSLYADVCVVGSGAGGSTVATVLAEAGLDVIVLEEGGYFRTSELTANIPGMMRKIMRGGGATVIMGRSPVPYLEGQCVGGTTVINGGMCWRTPERILDEWAQEGLPDLSADALDPHFSEVEKTLNARHQDEGSGGLANDLFKKGADSLGWRLSKNRRNQVHCVGTNDCVTGCPTGAKQSALQSWLPRFFKAGGRVYTRCRVEKITTSGGRASGVFGVLTDPYRSRRFRVKSRVTVLACGAIQTPLMLMKNGISKGANHLGRNFTIHPNVKLAAVFEESVDSRRGTHQAWQCTEFVEEGMLLAPGSIPAAFMTTIFPAFGPDLAEMMRQSNHVATGGVLVDDHASGTIKRTLGVPRVTYDVTNVDQEKFVLAAARLAELYFEAGAHTVYTSFHGMPPLRSVDEIPAMVSRRPRVEDTEYFTAHLMGTCRMSESSGRGVVRPNGEVWSTPGLFIADASILPGTIGVNPQVTIMAMAHQIGLKLADSVRAA